MPQYAKVRRVTLETSQGEITFRSGFEGQIAIYLDILLAGGGIVKWAYEETFFEIPIEHRKYMEVYNYLPDFQVFETEEDYFWLEGKGNLSQKDYNKTKGFAEAFPDERIQIWADELPSDKTRKPKQLTKLRRWKKIEPYVERLFNAQKMFREMGIKRPF